jgi:hypothetical protein
MQPQLHLYTPAAAVSKNNDKSQKAEKDLNALCYELRGNFVRYK